MPKRKRASASPAPAKGPPSLHRQKHLCTVRILSAQNALVSALRFGAGFDRQKYSRRRKTSLAKHDTKAVERLDQEYAVLKALDMNKLAEQQIRKTIAKVKSIKDHEALPVNVREIEKGTQDTATLNVTARLLKVPGVRKVVDECIGELKEILGVEVAQKVEKKEDEGRKKVKKEEEEEESEGVSEDNEEALAAFDARIAAPSSAEESDDELGDEHRPPSVVDSDREIEIEDSNSGSGSEEEEEEESDAESASEEEKPKRISKSKSASKASAADTKPTTSTFLPSLSHAGYYSGTESEASDIEDTKPKKNRRGQRARQKIWEAKYGDQAKHKQKDERNKGWDAKRGAVDDSRGGKRAKKDVITGDNAVELGKKEKKVTKKDDEGKLHPSWLAAKAAKDKVVSVKPMGTKIVFD